MGITSGKSHRRTKAFMTPTTKMSALKKRQANAYLSPSNTLLASPFPMLDRSRISIGTKTRRGKKNEKEIATHHDGNIPRLVYYCRIRKQFVNAHVRLTHQMKAMERTYGNNDSESSVLLDVLLASFKEALQPFHKYRHEAEQNIMELAETLPVWDWVKGVRGIGSLGLGLIVGEAGDLSNYDNPAKLWKRFGLAPGQRKIRGTEEGLEAGYSPRRRAMMHIVGDCLIKLQGKAGPYRKVYDDRKAYEEAQHPELQLGHRHKRAMRYMEKRFLLDLWKRWRKYAAHFNRAGVRGGSSDTRAP